MKIQIYLYYFVGIMLLRNKNINEDEFKEEDKKKTSEKSNNIN